MELMGQRSITMLKLGKLESVGAKLTLQIDFVFYGLDKLEFDGACTN